VASAGRISAARHRRGGQSGAVTSLVAVGGHRSPRTGPPLHIHPNTEEAFYVLAGQLRVRAGEHEHTLSAGGFILVPQGLPHTFTTAGPEPARFLIVHSPAGFEQFSIDVADAERQLGRELGPAELVPLASRQDWQFVGPPLSV
jgi:quercetin dioxygenase-like cupin family protein